MITQQRQSFLDRSRRQLPLAMRRGLILHTFTLQRPSTTSILSSFLFLARLIVWFRDFPPCQTPCRFHKALFLALPSSASNASGNNWKKNREQRGGDLQCTPLLGARSVYA
ncbi:hypothetical protein BJX70DRAFT_345357 [Aspergillus crustosus]